MFFFVSSYFSVAQTFDWVKQVGGKSNDGRLDFIYGLIFECYA
jgi:hypothetical protein